jgi:rare lipoprotein A
MKQEMEIGRDDENRPGQDPAPNGCDKIVPGLVRAYRSILMQVATLELVRIRQYAELAQTTVIGTASTYNPYVEGIDVEGIDKGDSQTSSGEFYDPESWTAAIQIDLRDYFGGVRYGQNYRPTYALVDNGERQIIVKINDVGPLKPGRVIDLNVRSMRYFDPTMQLGLLRDMRITLLPGDSWKPGPVGGELPITIAEAR